MAKNPSNMLIKGSLLALLIATACADDTVATGGIPHPNPSPNNRDNQGGDKTVVYASRRRYGGGKPTQASGSTWGSSWVRERNQKGSGQARPRPGTGQMYPRRRRWGRPANWVRPSQPANDWAKPVESESWAVKWVAPTHEPTPSPTKWSDDGHQVCDASNRNICCDLGPAMSEATKRTVCTLLGCDYDKCQWRDDGYGGGGYNGSAYSGGGEVAKDEKNAPVTFITNKVDGYPEPTETPGRKWEADGHEPTPAPTSWKDDGHDQLKWEADGHKPTPAPTSWKDDGHDQLKWEADGHKPTPAPTSWKDDGHDQCDVFARNICCTQDKNLPVKEKRGVCDDLGCIYEKCGWKTDGWEDDSYSKDGYDEKGSEPAWKNDGYNKDYDVKYDNKYDNKYQNDFGNNNNQNNKFDLKNNYGNGNYQKNKYDFQNNYGDDNECKADEREKCCTTNEKQEQVCKMLGCNINKCGKKDGGWDYSDNKEDKDKDKDKPDDYDTTPQYYTPDYGKQTPRYDVFPKYSDGSKTPPTLRPTYRQYASHDSTINTYSATGYSPTLPTMRPTYRKYSTNNDSTLNTYSAHGYNPTLPYSTNYDVSNNAYPDPNVYPNPDPNWVDPNMYPNVYPNPDLNANVYPNPVPNDVYPRQYGVGGYGN